MAEKFHKGDKITWNSGQGKAVGVIEEHITEYRVVDGQAIDASDEDPRYLVKNEHTGNITGHKPESLSKATDSNPRTKQKSSNPSSTDSSTFQPGDRVEWNTPQGKTTGKIVKQLTSPTDVKGHTAKASTDNPQYLVENDESGEQAAHKPDALTKLS